MPVLKSRLKNLHIGKSISNLRPFVTKLHVELDQLLVVFICPLLGIVTMLKKVYISSIRKFITYLDNVGDFDVECYNFKTVFVQYLSTFLTLSSILGIPRLSLLTFSMGFYGDGFIPASSLNFLNFYPILLMIAIL